MSSSNPIGIFDSGVGGVTVAKAVNKLMPNESIVYFGDTAHLPYGEKSTEAIKEYSLGIADYLVNTKNAKALLIACNSASAVAYYALKEVYGNKIPVINVIDSVAKHVADNYSNANIGVIGTRATISSGSYTQKITRHNSNLNIKALATPLLVPIIEEGLSKSNISLETIKHYLQHKNLENIKALILGCTHYPLILENINNFYQNNIQVIDSPTIVAQTVLERLTQLNLLAPVSAVAEIKFFVSDYTPVFEKIAQVIFDSIHLEEDNIWR